MKNRYTNKNGVKLLAAIMAFAMVLVAGSVMICDNESTGAATLPNAQDVKKLPPASGTAVFRVVEQTAPDEMNFIISEDVEVKLSGSGSGAVNFYIKDDAELTLDNTYTGATIGFYSVTSAPGTDRRIVSENIAQVSAELNAVANVVVKAKATSSETAGQNGQGYIEVGGENFSSVNRGDIWAAEWKEDAKKTIYSLGGIPESIGYEADHADTSTVELNGEMKFSTTIKNTYTTAGTTPSTTSNEFELTGAIFSKGLVVTLNGDGTIDIDSGSAPDPTEMTGMLKVTKGTIGTSNVTVTADSFTGVADNATLASATEFMAKPNVDAAGVLSDSAYVYNTGVQGTIKFNSMNAISFQQGSSFDGEIIGTPDASAVPSIKMKIGGDESGRYVTVTNDASSNKLKITADKTTISAGADVIGSGFSVSDIKGNVEFTTESGTKGSIELADGFKLVGQTLTMNDWDIIVPKESTIDLLNENNTPSKIEFTSGKMYVFGEVDGKPAEAGNITSTGGVYYTKANQADVKNFLASSVSSELAKASNSTDKNALYVLSQAQAAGWDISEAKIIWSDFSAGVVTEVYTTDSGEDLSTTGTTKAVDISLDAYKVPITPASTGTTIHVVEGTTFTISNQTTLQAIAEAVSSQTLSMDLKAGSELVIKDSNIMMEVSKDAKAEVKVTADVLQSNNVSGSISVGYMREYIVSGNISGSEITVYGKLMINDKAKISSVSKIDIKKGGELEVNGEFNVEGDIKFNPGSTGTVNGTMNIGTSDGGSDVTVTRADVTVTETGTMKVTAPNNRAVEQNRLTIQNSVAPIYDDKTGKVTNTPYIFKVLGTLDVRGTVKADHIYDMGAVTVNGISEGTDITISDGVTLTVGSVKGTVTVTDKDIMGESKRELAKLSDGNMITLTDVTGITVSESVSSTTYTVGKNSYKLYVCDMTVAGAIGAVKESTTSKITITKSANLPEGAYSGGKVEISGDMVIGKNVAFESSAANLDISGTITCVAEGASMKFNADSTAEVTGTITVKTEGDFSDGLTGQAYLSATEYIITDVSNGTVTTTYTTFENAIAKIADADEKTVTVYGSVTTSGNTDIPEGMTVDIEGSLSVSKSSVIVAKAGSTVVGEKISVSGTFTSEDHINDLDVREISGDVVSANGKAKTWTSLANALAIATPGSVITADKNVSLSSSVTIPADVTVQTEYDVTVKKNAVLTVDGTLTLSKGTIMNDSTASIPDVPGKLVVGKTGVVSVVNEPPSIFTDVSGAHFQRLVGAKDYFYVTNVDYAVSAVDDKLEGSKIAIVGEVDVGEITFAKGEKMDKLFISIEPTSASCAYNTLVTGDLELVGADLTIKDDVKFSGSITATANGADAKLGFEEVSAFLVSTVTDNTASTPVDYLLINCGRTSSETISTEGRVDVVSGTVTVGQITSSTRAAGTIWTYEDFAMTISEGATLQVLENSNVKVDTSEKKDRATFTVDGDLVVKKGTVQVQASAIMDVYGSVTVSETATTGLRVHGTLNVLGTVTVSEEAGKEGELTNYGVITVGSKPTALGAAGTVTGKVKLASAGYVLIYDGEVGKIVSSAGTDARSTAVTINGVEYVKIVGGTDVRTILQEADIELTGIDGFVASGDHATKIYSDEAMTKPITGGFNVGDYDAIYFELDASTVKGLVSVGTGIEVFIDGAKYANGGNGFPLAVGTHTVDYNILTGYDGDNVVITFNGQTVQKGGQITVTADMKDFSLIVTGATPSSTVIPVPAEPSESEEGMGLTDYLLIVLVVLAAILVVIVAIRMLRN